MNLTDTLHSNYYNSFATTMESRYTNRFRGLKERTGEQLKNIDSAGNLTARITEAKGSIEAQRNNINELLGTAQEMITGITTHQQMMNVALVKNIPLPTQEVVSSPSKKLGYVQLTMRFLQAGLIHYMEEMNNATARIAELDKMIGNLAVYDQEVDIIGSIQALDLESLERQALPGETPTPAEPLIKEVAPTTLPVTPPPSPPESVTAKPQVGPPRNAAGTNARATTSASKTTPVKK